MNPSRPVNQLRSLLRQHWNRLPALSALKCSSTSCPDCDKLIKPQLLSLSFCPPNAPWRKKKSRKKRYLPSNVFVWFSPALVPGCLLCCAYVSYSACSSFFCCVKTNDVFSEEPWIERDVDFLWRRQNSILYCDVVGWKDIANIFTNFVLFYFFAGGCFVLLYIKLSAD